MNKTGSYYWISYYQITAYGNVFGEDVINIHPFEKMKKLRKKYKDCNFTLLNFKELKKEEYDYYLDN